MLVYAARSTQYYRRLYPDADTVLWQTVRDAMDEADDPMVPLWQQSAKQQLRGSRSFRVLPASLFERSVVHLIM